MEETQLRPSFLLETAGKWFVIFTTPLFRCKIFFKKISKYVNL